MSESMFGKVFKKTATHLKDFKKFKILKLLELFSPGVIGCFFISVCFAFSLFFLDFPGVILGSPGQPGLRSWVGLNWEQVNRVGFLERGGDGCDLFDGNWVWDESYPLYESKNCLFMDEGFRCSENGRRDKFYTKWRWQPKACNLPRFDAKIMLEMLRNRRFVFVGDSIGRNQWESLLCMLSYAVPNKTSIYEVNGNPITKHSGFLVFKFREYNCTLEYYRAPFLVVQSRPPAGVPEKVKTTLKLDQVHWSCWQWKDADVLVFNSGHWWYNTKTIREGCYFQEGEEVKMEMSVESAHQKSIEKVFNWLSSEINFSKTQVFFRSFAPVHFSGGDWNSGGGCHLETFPDLRSASVTSETSSQLKLVSEEFSKLSDTLRRKMIFLNVTAMTSQRKDGHSSLYYLPPETGPMPLHRQDCSHWCLPGVPDSWNELLYAVFLKSELARTENSTKPFHAPQV